MSETALDAPCPQATAAGPTRRGWLPVAAWCFYDWANSAFPTVITTFIFSVYFSRAVAASPVEGTVLWSRALMFAGLAVAVASPILGAIADASGPRKPWLFSFTAICVLTTACLWFVQPDAGFVTFALATFVLASISYQFAIIFYDAMLKDIAPPDMIGRISGWGWAVGYVGALVCLALCLWLVRGGGDTLGLDPARSEPVRATSVLVALWFAVFAIPVFTHVPDRPTLGKGLGRAVRAGLRRLPEIVALLRRNPPITRFLVAHMLYTDGLVTLFAFGGIFAAVQFGMTAAEILVFGIVLNVSAGAGAAAFAWLDDAMGSKRTIMLALAGMIASAAGLLLTHDVRLFWLFAAVLGVFVGPAQAAGRSLMARLSPKGIETEMFGLYALASKATAFAGPFALGLAVQWSGSQRIGMSVVIVFLICGLAVLTLVREPARERTEQ